MTFESKRSGNSDEREGAAEPGVSRVTGVPPSRLVPPSSGRRKRAPRPPEEPPVWKSVVGACAGLLVLAALVVFYFFPPAGDQRAIVILFVALGMGFCFAFVGGRAAVKFQLPLLPKHPLSGSAAGGFGAFLVTLFVGNWLFVKQGDSPKTGGASSAPALPHPFALRLRVKEWSDEIAPDIDFRNGTERAENIAFQRGAGYYLVHDVDLPSPGKKYEAQFRPVALDSVLRGAEGTTSATPDRLTRLCVTAQLKPSRPDGDFGFVECAFGGVCSVSKDDPGWVANCGATARFEFPWLEGTAHAQPSSNPAVYWISSSLQTLKKRHDDPKDNPPYMHLSVSGQIGGSGAASGARYYRVATRVNGVPVFVDGWRPDEISSTVEPGGSFSYEFPLQNLGFSGGEAGFERLSIVFSWLDGSKREIGQTPVERKLIAFRDLPEEAAESGSATITSSGEYEPSDRLDHFSIVLASTPSLAEAGTVKGLVDRAGQRFEQDQLLAVLRPPLTPWRLQRYENKNYAVLLGTRKPSGQIAFAFDRAEADALCSYVYANRAAFSGGVLETVFRYEWPTVGGAGGENPHRYHLCRSE